MIRKGVGIINFVGPILGLCGGMDCADANGEILVGDVRETRVPDHRRECLLNVNHKNKFHGCSVPDPGTF